MLKPNVIALPQGNARQDGLATKGVANSNDLSPILIQVLHAVQRDLGLERSQDVNSKVKTSAEIEKLVVSTAFKLGFDISPYERDQVISQVERDSKEFGILQELVDNPQVTDIIVAGYKHIVVQQSRANYTTSLKFPNQEAYEAFVERLLTRAGASYSTKKPIADGMIGGFARLHAVHRSISDQGPYLTIRLNRFSKVSSKDLLSKGLAPATVLQYLEAVIRGGHTLLIVGEVGTGKTTLARALAASIPTEESILVIEDTPEIKLDHPQCRYVVTRNANTEGEGRVSPAEVIKGGMRMAMNRIVFGEIRDPEAAEAFIDVCASGHPGLSTIHARNASDAIVRLQLFLGRAQKGVSKEVLNQQIATAISVIVFVDMCHETKKRRIINVKEIGEVSDDVVKQRDIFVYQVADGLPSWKLVNAVSNFREALEKHSTPLFLHKLPRQIDFDEEQLYREAQQR